MDLLARDFIFIIGSPRSGTTMLQILLGNHPQVATTVELTLYTKYVGPWLETWDSEVRNRQENGWNQGLPMLWNAEENDDFLHEFLRRAYEKVLARNPAATHILDKCPGNALHVRTIKRLIPSARFVHIVRDGRDVACSLRAAREAMGFGFEQVAQSAGLWKRWVESAREAGAFSDDYFELRYESFLDRGADQYEKVLSFCGLAVDRPWIEKTLEENSFARMKERRATADPNVTVSTHHYRQGKAGGWREEFSAKDRYEFHRVAGDLLMELSYAQPGWWHESEIERVLEPIRSEVRRRWAVLEDGWPRLRQLVRFRP